MTYTENAFRSINFLKEDQIPSNPSSEELWAVEVAGSGNSLFDFKWSDHELDDMSWVCADNFTWLDGTVYTQAYEHLATDIEDKTLQSETISGTTVQFYLADDGHKICPVNQETNVSTIYTNTGVAWYYILDTTNTQFKLPQTKYGFSGLRDTVGNYVPESLPNITGKTGFGGSSVDSDVGGAFYRGEDSEKYLSGTGPYTNPDRMVYIDASRSSSTYQDNAPVQQRATQMYLYFYVGQFSKTAIEQTAGITTEQLNQKVDVSDLVEAHMVIDSYQSGANWYRLYSDGWVEQGGYTNVPETSTTTITLLIQMLDTNYIALAQNNSLSTAGDTENGVGIERTSTSQVKLFTHYINPNTISASWLVCGKAA